MKIGTHVKYKYTKDYLRYLGKNRFISTHRLYDGVLRTIEDGYITYISFNDYNSSLLFSGDVHTNKLDKEYEKMVNRNKKIEILLDN